MFGHIAHHTSESEAAAANQALDCSDVNIDFFVVPDIESKNLISIRISVHSGI